MIEGQAPSDGPGARKAGVVATLTREVKAVDFEKAGIRLAAGLTAAAALLGFLGAKDGALTRILRNEGLEFFGALVVVLVGISLGLLASALASHKTLAPISLVVAVVVFFGGLIWMSQLAINSTSAKERPQIAAKFVTDATGGLVLEGTVRAEGLTVDEHILIRVLGRSASERFLTGSAGRVAIAEDTDRPTPGPPSTNLLFGVRAGPSSDGKVERAFTVPISPGIYDEIDVEAMIETEAGEPAEARTCTAATRSFGCLSLWIPQVPSAPLVSVGWDVSSSTPSLKIQVKADGMNAEEVAFLDVTGGDSGGVGDKLVRSSFTPTRNGVIDTSLLVPIPDPYRRVCVTAEVRDLLDGGADGSGNRAEGYRCPDATAAVMVAEMLVPRSSSVAQ